MTDTFKPCPFCKREPQQMMRIDSLQSGDENYLAARCEHHTHWMPVEQWNRRSLDAGAGMGAVPAGWKLIRAERADRVSLPRSPTIEMENAGDKADCDYSNNRFAGLGHLGRVAFIYHHMLAARPKE